MSESREQPGWGSSQAEQLSAPLAVPSQAQPRRHRRELEAADSLFLQPVGSLEPLVILQQPCRTEHHHLLEGWRQHGSQGGNGTFLESGEPSDGYVWVEHARSCFLHSVFLIELVNSGSQGAWLWWHLTLCHPWNLQCWWEAARRSASIPGCLLSFLHPVGATEKAHPSLWYFSLYTIKGKMQNMRFHLILSYKVSVSMLIWYRVTKSFLSQNCSYFCLEN